MLKSIEGIYRNGKIELLESAPPEAEARVLVTFLPAPGDVMLEERGITQMQAAELRGRLESFAEDWDRPEMDVYDDL